MTQAAGARDGEVHAVDATDALGAPSLTREDVGIASGRVRQRPVPVDATDPREPARQFGVDAVQGGRARVEHPVAHRGDEDELDCRAGRLRRRHQAPDGVGPGAEERGTERSDPEPVRRLVVAGELGQDHARPVPGDEPPDLGDPVEPRVEETDARHGPYVDAEAGAVQLTRRLGRALLEQRVADQQHTRPVGAERDGNGNGATDRPGHDDRGDTRRDP